MTKPKITLTIAGALLALAAIAAAALYAGRTTRTTDGAPAPHVTLTAATVRLNWIMNANQWQQLTAYGYSGAAPEFQLCTSSEGPTQNEPCETGMTPAFANYYTLRTFLRQHAGAEPPAVNLDLESVPFGTPAYQGAAEGYYDRLAAADARTFGVKLIASPVTSPAAEATIEADAARDGAFAVELQIQYGTSNPVKYQQLVSASVKAIRAANKRTVIIAGIASDAGGYPTTATLMYASWSRTHLLVDGYWLNMARWTVHSNGTPATGCAPTGCVDVAASFLRKIDGS